MDKRIGIFPDGGIKNKGQPVGKQAPGGQVKGNLRHRLLFPDPISLRYLQEIPSLVVLEREAELIGYELHIVEQWACSRTQLNSFIVTYTGLSRHKVVVGIISAPSDEANWPQQLKVFLKAMTNQYAWRKQTLEGTVMVTNLSNLPSGLTAIPVPNGSLTHYWELFIVNENLKRLNCSGRAGLTLNYPSAATEAKFMQSYRTHEKVPAKEAVIELVRICQSALAIFTKLEPDISDGLLCDQTERAISDWWIEIGMEYFTAEPHDGILGPTTVAAILGLLIGARNRLSANGAPVSKDALDFKALKRGISYFQKAQKLPRTRRLDSRTLDRLHQITSKAANNEGWAVPKVVKSTVAELSGKGGEMVLGIVGGRDRTGIAEIETLDFGKFVETVTGERCEWLWYGRSKKLQSSDISGLVGREDENVKVDSGIQPVRVAATRRDYMTHRDGAERQNNGLTTPSNFDTLSVHSDDSDNNSKVVHRTVLRSMAGRMNEAKSGIDRIRDVVGFPGWRNHSQKHPTISVQRKSADATLSASSAQEWYPADEMMVQHGKSLQGAYDSEFTNVATSHCLNVLDALQGHTVSTGIARLPDDATSDVSQSHSTDDLNKNMYIRSNPKGVFVNHKDKFEHSNITTETSGKRRRSFKKLSLVRSTSAPAVIRHSGDKLLRRPISFSLIEDILSREDGITTSSVHEQISSSPVNLTSKIECSPRAGTMLKHLRELEHQGQQATEKRIASVNELKERAASDVNEFRIVYEKKRGSLQDLHNAITDLLKEERGSAASAFRETETLGAKLEYELNALASKVEDVEDGINDLEHQIQGIEARKKELEMECVSPGFLWRIFSLVSK